MAELIRLKNWFGKNFQKLESNGIDFSFSQIAKTDNPAQYFDLATETYMARVTLWETGDCDFEVIGSETAESVIFENQIIDSENQLSSFLNSVFLKLPALK